MKSTQAIAHLRDVIRRQHKALATEECYVFWVRRYISTLHRIPPELPSEKKLELFLTGLALRDNVAATTQNQAFNAVLFFYKEVLGKPLGNVDSLRAKKPVRERHAPTVADTKRLLETIRNEGGYPTNLIARMLYGCGLRVSEPLNLRIKELNLERSHAKTPSLQDKPKTLPMPPHLRCREAFGVRPARCRFSFRGREFLRLCEAMSENRAVEARFLAFCSFSWRLWVLCVILWSFLSVWLWLGRAKSYVGGSRSLGKIPRVCSFSWRLCALCVILWSFIGLVVARPR